jgi:hypothetical protein
MTNEDALALIFVCLHTLINHQHCLKGQTAPAMPLGLLRNAVLQLDDCGLDMSTVRAALLNNGIDFADISHNAKQVIIQQDCTVSSDTSNKSDSELVDEPASVTARRRSWNRMHPVMEEDAKFHEGWSKSRIGREFRLNRRTIIRICTAGDVRKLQVLSVAVHRMLVRHLHT